MPLQINNQRSKTKWDVCFNVGRGTAWGIWAGLTRRHHEREARGSSKTSTQPTRGFTDVDTEADKEAKHTFGFSKPARSHDSSIVCLHGMLELIDMVDRPEN